jgi:hypothetical protein
LRPPDSYTRREIPDGFDPGRWVMIVRAEHGLSKYFLGGKPHTHHDTDRRAEMHDPHGRL